MPTIVNVKQTKTLEKIVPFIKHFKELSGIVAIGSNLNTHIYFAELPVIENIPTKRNIEKYV